MLRVLLLGALLGAMMVGVAPNAAACNVTDESVLGMRVCVRDAADGTTEAGCEEQGYHQETTAIAVAGHGLYATAGQTEHCGRSSQAHANTETYWADVRVQGVTTAYVENSYREGETQSGPYTVDRVFVGVGVIGFVSFFDRDSSHDLCQVQVAGPLMTYVREPCPRGPAIDRRLDQRLDRRLNRQHRSPRPLDAGWAQKEG